eukprot:365795-Chlamydomonas_euryale.AAC.11
MVHTDAQHASSPFLQRVTISTRGARSHTAVHTFSHCHTRPATPPHPAQDVSDAPRVMGPEALIRDKIKQTRHREGYQEGISTTFKSTSAVAFVISDTPVEMLGQMTKFAIEGPESWEVRPTRAMKGTSGAGL